MTALGVPTLPYSIWYASSGAAPVAYRNSDDSRTAVLASRWPLYEPARSPSKNRRAAGSSTGVSQREQRVVGDLGLDRGLDRRPRLAQRPRLSVDREGRLVAEQVRRPSPRARTRAPGAPSGTLMTSSAALNRSSPSLAITIGAALWAR